MSENFIHLGHPLILPAKNRSEAYNFVLAKFKSKLSTYKANSLSHAARVEFIKSVFSSIHVYYMSNIIFSKKFHATFGGLVLILALSIRFYVWLLGKIFVPQQRKEI
jgi:hypothetical protein